MASKSQPTIVPLKSHYRGTASLGKTKSLNTLNILINRSDSLKNRTESYQRTRRKTITYLYGKGISEDKLMEDFRDIIYDNNIQVINNDDIHEDIKNRYFKQEPIAQEAEERADKVIDFIIKQDVR